jgi:hypothetical protein
MATYWKTKHRNPVNFTKKNLTYGNWNPRKSFDFQMIIILNKFAGIKKKGQQWA